MTLAQSFTTDRPLPRCRAVALLIDGQNIAAAHAAACRAAAQALGPLAVGRVYGDVTTLEKAWLAQPGLRAVHSGTGKNAADMLMVVEAMELAMAGHVDGFVLASSDGDFTALAMALRARGFPVLGVVEAKASAALRASFTEVTVLAAPAPASPAPISAEHPAPPLLATAAPDQTPSPELAATVRQINHVIIALVTLGPISASSLGQALRASGLRRPTSRPSWKDYLRHHLPDYEATGTGPATMIRRKA